MADSTCGQVRDGTPVQQASSRRIDAGLVASFMVAICYGLALGAASTQRYLIFGDGGDLVDYMQMMWNTVHGHILLLSHVHSAGGALRGGHIEPILIPFSLLLVPFPDPIALLILQTGALASSVPLMYMVARTHGHTVPTAVLLGIFFVANPHIQYANMHEFHPDSLAVPAMLGAMLAFDRQRWWLLMACVLLMTMVKEQMLLFTVGLGLYWWIARGSPRIGQRTLLFACIYLLTVMLPWYLATSSQFSHDYGAFFGAQNAAGHHSGVITHVVDLVSDPERRDNVMLALLPSGFAFLLDVSALVALMPLAGLFVGNPQINAIWWHHYVTIAPVLAYATSKGLARPAVLKRAARLCTLLIGWTLVVGLIYAEQPMDSMYWVTHPSALQTTDHARAVDNFLRSVPADVPLAADPALATHLGRRELLYKLTDPQQVTFAPYVLLDLHSDIRAYPRFLFLDVHGSADALAKMQALGGFRIVRADRKHGLFLYANCIWKPAPGACPASKTHT